MHTWFSSVENEKFHAFPYLEGSKDYIIADAVSNIEKTK